MRVMWMNEKNFDKIIAICESDRLEARIEQIYENLKTVLDLSSFNEWSSIEVFTDETKTDLKALKDQVRTVMAEMLRDITDAKREIYPGYMGAMPDSEGLNLTGAIADLGLKIMCEALADAMKPKDAPKLPADEQGEDEDDRHRIQADEGS